jgi:hypothetical protein
MLALKPGEGEPITKKCRKSLEEKSKEFHLTVSMQKESSPVNISILAQ